MSSFLAYTWSRTSTPCITCCLYLSQDFPVPAHLCPNFPSILLQRITSDGRVSISEHLRSAAQRLEYIMKPPVFCLVSLVSLCCHASGSFFNWQRDPSDGTWTPAKKTAHAAVQLREIDLYPTAPSRIAEELLTETRPSDLRFC